MNLDKEGIVLLVQEYERHRVLWDAKDKWYFHKDKKNGAWDEVAKAIQITTEDAKKKISSLLGSFRREKAKATKSLGTGKGASEVYKSDWFAFKCFEFLMDKNMPRDHLNSENILENIFESDETSQESDNNFIETTQTSSHETNTRKDFLKPTSRGKEK